MRRGLWLLAGVACVASAQLTAPQNVKLMPASSCVGTAIDSTMSQATIQGRLTANTRTCWAAGTYHLNGYLMPATGHLAACSTRRTCILTGDDTHLGAFRVNDGTNNVTIRGFVMTNFATPSTWPMGVVQARAGGLIDDNEVRLSFIGITAETGVTLRGNYTHHNRWSGISGGPSQNIVIENNEIAFNNTSHADIGIDAAGLKLVGSDAGTSVVFRGNYSHDNYGQGFWCDGNCRNSVVENNRIENNWGAGIDWEISWDVKIRGNTLKGNMGALRNKGGSCYDAQILTNNSQGVEISGNTVDSDGVNGICASDTTRSERAVFPQFLSNINVHDNTIIARGLSVSGVIWDRSPAGLLWDANRNVVDALSAVHWQWETKMTWSQWQASNHDKAGSIGL